ncbi:hypothetical protein BO86DRAFT_460231 [Aspergillus japonicus CBS 114.51]|uniref:DAGKc domain-containing protein n=1 Tax=Aspergillus japonicus CBS 114.51 TaxID=1448312 RepID=A0A8T8WKE6_ASPJA|nr:hypothetical protein BO86DRAFT_460231 [Aspergillus japonicus CBS 114.51]RAH75950.1 hypothetical protein BO86DRAFT_460231 [Aspergillus japonicus CBS 114.51]
MAPALGPDNESFQCELNGHEIQCRHPQTQKEIIISINNLICILSRGDKLEAPRHVMLFLWLDENEFEVSRESVQIRLLRYTSLPRDFHSRTGGKGMSVFKNILSPLLSQLGVREYAVHETRTTQTIVELCHTKLMPCAQAGIKQTIILLSGDGGLTDIIDSFHGTAIQYLAKPIIALIPTGTGNAMASSIGLLKSRAAGLSALLHGHPAPIPAFLATFSAGSKLVTEAGSGRVNINSHSQSKTGHPTVYGGVVASWGLHAALVADSDTAEYRKYGAERFQMAAKEILFPSNGDDPHKFRGSISFTWRDRQTNKRHTEALGCEEHMYVLVTLVSNLEPGFTISPLSAPLDGCLRIIHFGPMTSEQAMNLMSNAYQGGKHVNDARVTYREIESIRITLGEVDERWRKVCIDGKIIAVESGGWLEVQKISEHYLNILIPAHGDSDVWLRGLYGSSVSWNSFSSSKGSKSPTPACGMGLLIKVIDGFVAEYTKEALPKPAGSQII